MVKALVLYHSQEFGNTAAMAEAVAEGLQDAGCEVDLFNTNEGRFDVTQFPQYDSEKRATIIFDKEITIIGDPYGEERASWDDVM